MYLPCDAASDLEAAQHRPPPVHFLAFLVLQASAEHVLLRDLQYVATNLGMVLRERLVILRHLLPLNFRSDRHNWPDKAFLQGK